MEIKCGPLLFTSNFDSGNLDKVELVQPIFDQKTNDLQTVCTGGPNFSDYEVNVWTRQDCGGTKYENGNRTWFYFGVRGGKSGAILKINVLNLNRQTKLFEQGMQPVVCSIPDKPKWERIKDRVTILETGVRENSCGISFRQKLPLHTKKSTLYIAFTYPFSYLNMCDWLNSIDNVYSLPIPTPFSDQQLVLVPQIYYNRECVCNSLEERRVELLTITSFDGQLSTREEYLHNLFPERSHLRPHKFHDKKIVFLSSRVHPGEVPAQFVMNGIIKFLLDEKDPRAVMLRKLFVFKLIPILNPDGVYNGHYRTDPRGVNLNRVYLKPSPSLHPSIYAARKLILYSHYGYDTPDDYVYEVDEDIQCSTIAKADQEPKDKVFGSLPNIVEDSNEAQPMGNDSEDRTLCAGCMDLPQTSSELIDTENIAEVDECMQVKKPDVNIVPVEEEVETHQCTFESCDEDSVMDYRDIQKTQDCVTHSAASLLSMPSNSSSSKSAFRISLHQRVSSPALKRSEQAERKAKNQEAGQVKSLPGRFTRKNLAYKKPKEVESGLFLYLDMHGHASKRGIFMYGNHFNESSLQTECILLPRLMSMNCQHFDFSACNFTERLMSLKDRRDGSSREGSGRVAVLRLTGLIRSYTLECNYNTGRLVNHLISRPESYGFIDPISNPIHHPPKFTPDLYEAAGKSLGESILDLTGINPWSRLKFTEYHNLDGLRSFLYRRLQHSFEYSMKSSTQNQITSTVPKMHATSNITNASQRLHEPSGSKRLTTLKQNLKTKITDTQSSCSSNSMNSGPLIPKKENQALALPHSSSSLLTKTKIGKSSKSTISKSSINSNISGLGKSSSAGSSKTAMGIESTVSIGNTSLHPISASSDNRLPSLKKVTKSTEKKKKMRKSKNKSTKAFK